MCERTLTLHTSTHILLAYAPTRYDFESEIERGTEAEERNGRVSARVKNLIKWNTHTHKTCSFLGASLRRSPPPPPCLACFVASSLLVRPVHSTQLKHKVVIHSHSHAQCAETHNDNATHVRQRETSAQEGAHANIFVKFACTLQTNERTSPHINMRMRIRIRTMNARTGGHVV